MSGNLEGNIKGRLSNITKDLVDHMADKFKYPGSISTSHGYSASIKAYNKLGINDLDKISELMGKGVWPVVKAGSRSQGSHLYSSNFCLEMYAMHGIKDPDALIYLAENGVTPIHVGSAEFKLNLDLAEMTGREIEQKVKKLYKEKFKPEARVKIDYPSNFRSDYIFDDDCSKQEFKLWDFLGE
ncbi:hypothetical protein HOD29_03780 [archaeon]|mgnify:CR=1 FL=1|jgi:hypothetical protein|nr:hypothetical protein [archaeon]